MNLKHLASVAVMSLLAMQAAPAAAIQSPKDPIPADVNAFVDSGGTVIAYKSVSSEKGERTVAMVVRHERVCELIALRSELGKVRVTGRTTRAVDCVGTLENANAGYRALDENLELSSDELKVTNNANTAQGGWYSYSFRYSSGKWHLSGGEFSNSYGPDADDGYLQERTGSAAYPKDFGFISMDDFKPEDIDPAMDRNKSVARG